MSQSIETLLMIVAAIIVAVIAAVAMKGITQGNADNAAERARTSFGKNVKFTLVETGTQTAYVEDASSNVLDLDGNLSTTDDQLNSGYYAKVTLTFTNLVNVDKDSYVRLQVMGDSLYKWKIFAVKMVDGNATVVKDLSTAFKIVDLNNKYVAGKDFKLYVYLSTSDSVTTEDKVVLGISVGDAPTQSVEVKLVP